MDADPAVDGAGRSGWYARVPASVIRDRRLSSGTRDVLLALLLYANDDGVCWPSQTTIADDLGVRREEVNRRMRTLRELGYLSVEAPKTKGGPAVYRLSLPQSAAASCAPTCDQTITPCEPTCDQTITGVCANDHRGCDRAITGGMRKRSQRTSPERTEPSTNANEQIQEQTDADASGASDDVAQPSSPALPVEKKSRRPRKLTDEQLEAHGAEQQWCREVLAELARRLDVKTVPRAGQQKAAAKWLYGELAGVEDGQRRLWQCYEITKRSPFWCDKTLLLSDLLRPIPEYRRDPAGYRAAIEREIETGKRRQEAGNGSISGHRRDRIGSRQSPGRLTPEYYAAAGRRMAQRSAEAEDAREQFAKFRAGLGSSVASSG